MPACKSCGNVTDSTWKFCRYCGSPSLPVLSFDDLITGLIDQSNDIFVASEEISRTGFILRIPLAREVGATDRGIVIQNGQQAVIIRAGASPEVIGPQTYDLPENTSTDGEVNQMLLFRELSTQLSLEISDLVSQDPLPVTVQCS